MESSVSRCAASLAAFEPFLPFTWAPEEAREGTLAMAEPKSDAEPGRFMLVSYCR